MEKIKIWGEQIPYNTGKSKRDVMTLNKHLYLKVFLDGIMAIFAEQLDQDTGRMDTFTWHDEIVKGEADERFSDVPYLIPYPVKGSKRAVIIAPGGWILL